MATAPMLSRSLYWRLSSFYFAYFIVLGTMVPYLPLYLKSLGLDAWHIGLLTSALVGTKIVAPNIWGWLADHTRRRMAIIRLGCLMAVACFALVFWRQDFAMLLLVTVGYSFFWNAVLAQFEAVTLVYLGAYPEQYSRIRLWGSIGFIVAVAVFGWLFDQVSLRSFPLIIVLGLLAIFASSFLVVDPLGHREAVHALPDNTSFWQRLRQPAVIVFFTVCFLMVFSHGPYYTFFTLLMEKQQHSRTLIGLLWGLGVVAEVVMFWFMHRLMPQFGVRRLLLCSLLLTAARWLAVAWVPQSLPVMLVAQCIHAFSFGAFHSAAIEVVRRLFSLQQSGKAQAFYSAVGYGAGNALGSLVSGALWQRDPALPYLLSAAVCLIGFALVWRALPESVLQAGVSQAETD